MYKFKIINSEDTEITMELYDDGRSLTETVSWLGSVFADFGLRQSDDVLIWFTPQNTA